MEATDLALDSYAARVPRTLLGTSAPVMPKGSGLLETPPNTLPCDYIPGDRTRGHTRADVPRYVKTHALHFVPQADRLSSISVKATSRFACVHNRGV